MKECPKCKRCFPDAVDVCPNEGETTFKSIKGDALIEKKYRLETRLGEGGMGIVYKARHNYLKSPHVIKIISALVGSDPESRVRFQQEAIAAKSVQHPNVVLVTDFGEQDDMPFLVMDYIDGESLEDLLKREKKLSPEKAVEIMSAICEGLEAIHEQGIIDRDLKPLNIMIQKGLPLSRAVKIIDFGLAKFKSTELLKSLVQAKSLGAMGTPVYMSPEQFENKELDVQSDIYSLGIILFQMLTGDLPFKGSILHAIIKKHLMDPPPTFAERGLIITPELEEIEKVVRRALEKAPENRYSSAREFSNELKDALSKEQKRLAAEEAMRREKEKQAKKAEINRLNQMYRRHIIHDEDIVKDVIDKLKEFIGEKKFEELTQELSSEREEIEVKRKIVEPKNVVSPPEPKKIVSAINTSYINRRGFARGLLLAIPIFCLGGILAILSYYFGFYNLDFKRAASCAQKEDYACAVEFYTKALQKYPNYAEAYNGRGWTYFNQGSYDEAVADCTQAISLKADYAEALTCRGRAYGFKDENEKSFTDCNDAVRLKPDYAQAYNCRGNAFYAQANYDKAIKDFDKAIELEPDFARAYNNRGNSQRAKGNDTSALNDYSKAIQIDPKLVIAYHNRGKMYHKQEKYGEAIQDYTNAIGIKPDYAEAFINRGNAYFAQGNHNEAIKDYDRAVKIKPDYADAYRNRAELYFLIGNYAQSIKDFSEVIKLQPDNHDIFIRRGNSYAENGNFELAIKDFGKAIELKPDVADIYLNRGNTYSNSNKYKEAIEDYNKTIELKPDYVEAYKKRGDTYLKDGKYDSAINDYNITIKLNPKYAKAFYNRGMAYYRKDNNNQAIEDYEKAVEMESELGKRLSSEFANAYFERGLAYQNKGDKEDSKDYEYLLAEEDYTEAIRLYPQFHIAYNNRGNIYLYRKEYDNAISDYNQAIEINPEYSMAYNNRGVAYSRQGKSALAEADFQKALKLDPNNQTAKSNLSN